MIKFLHTADIHLGKVFHEHSLIEDQEYILNTLYAILNDESYRALLIAGDVFDRSIPSPDAVQLFSAFLGKLKTSRPDLKILIIPGNHDSPLRLAYGKELFAGLGVHFVTDPYDAVNPIFVYAKTGGSTAEGETQECAAFFLLPFLNAGSLNAEETAGKDGGGFAEPIRSQAKLAEEAAARLEKARLSALSQGADYTVLAAHVFAVGGKESKSERVFLGTAEQVSANLFAGFDYAAFGHLHSFQKAGPNSYYSGSPLAYSFEEAGAEKVFLSVEFDRSLEPDSFRELDGNNGYKTGNVNTISVNPIPIKPKRKLTRLKGSFQYFLSESGSDKSINDAAEDYLEITLTGKDLALNALSILRNGRFPNLLSVKQDEAFAALSEEQVRVRQEALSAKRSTDEDFSDFLIDIYGRADEEKIDLFRELLIEAEKEERL
ncbi:MAG: exonuclease subunit SbcD [Treponema sp.]|jgi:exonuclease SbcD|nr:exonuclease subunit SbcD [Treponema sp.]